MMKLKRGKFFSVETLEKMGYAFRSYKIVHPCGKTLNFKPWLEDWEKDGGFTDIINKGELITFKFVEIIYDYSRGNRTIWSFNVTFDGKPVTFQCYEDMINFNIYELDEKLFEI